MRDTFMNLKKLNSPEISNFYKKFFGIRILKTAIATTLAVFIAQLIHLHSPMMAGFAAIITMKASIFDTTKAITNRLLSTVVGALVASGFHYLGIIGYIPMAIGIIIVINICNYFKWKESITLAVMVFIIVMAHKPVPPDYLSYWEYGINRTIDTIIGLVIGFSVNYFIFPPDRTEFIIKTYEKSLKESELALKEILKGKRVSMSYLISDIEVLTTELRNFRRDKKLGPKYKIQTYQLSKMNSQFYTVFGIIAQFSDEGRVPILSESNKMALEEYFGDDIYIDTGNFNPEFETAFNYYLDELVVLLYGLRESIKKLKKDVKIKEDLEN